MRRTRRSVLRAGCGVLASGTLAGCVGDSSSGGSDTDTETAETGTAPSASPSSTATAVRTVTDQPTTTGRETEPPTTTPQTTETREATTDSTQTSGTNAVNHGCNAGGGLSFYSISPAFWDRRSVYVALVLGAGAHVRLVAYEGDTVLGTAESRAPPGGKIVVDGQSIALEKPLTGEHTIRVVMYADSDGDGEFDPESATPCRYEGEVVEAGPETIDFSQFAPGTSTTP